MSGIIHQQDNLKHVERSVVTSPTNESASTCSGQFDSRIACLTRDSFNVRQECFSFQAGGNTDPDNNGYGVGNETKFQMQPYLGVIL